MREQQGNGGINRALAGALAGLAGTAIMTVLMKPGLARYLSSRWRPAEFVPKQIVQKGMERTGHPDALSERQKRLASAVAHLGYGAAVGTAYALLRSDRRSIPAGLAGGTWGVVVWAVGYEGWLPALGVRPATTDQPPTKWPLPIANHVLYGVTTALVYDRLRARA